jgi:hypothetical protein
MSLRQKYLNILAGMVPAGAAGISLLLGSSAPTLASPDPAGSQPQAAPRVSERLAAIRDAVSAVAGQDAVSHSKASGDLRLAWGNWWRNGGWGWGRPWGGWGWPNWNNWHNWNNWNNWWRNW